jgi:acetyltransferase-like isoleucine patch superfamily enzyme
MKVLFKAVANGTATLLVVPAFLLYRLTAFLLGADKAFPGWSQSFALVPGLTGTYLRRAFYRWILPLCGKDAWIGFGTVFSHASAEVGARAYIGMYCCLGDVVIGPDALIGSHVSIINGGAQHGIARLDMPVREQPGAWPRIHIGADTWIGDRVVVLVDVGDHCVVGAGAVVTKPLPDFAIAVGVPAAIIGYRDHQDSETDAHATAATS